MHELALNDAAAVEKLIKICSERITDQEARSKVIELVHKAKKSQKIVVSLDTLKLDKNDETIPLAELANLLDKLIGEGGFREMEEICEASSRCAGTEEPEALDKYALRQKLPSSIVSLVQTLARFTMTHSCRNFHTQGTLRMKSSAIS